MNHCAVSIGLEFLVNFIEDFFFKLRKFTFGRLSGCGNQMKILNLEAAVPEVLHILIGVFPLNKGIQTAEDRAIVHGNIGITRDCLAGIPERFLVGKVEQFYELGVVESETVLLKQIITDLTKFFCVHRAASPI
jgi:hypothetical protein